GRRFPWGNRAASAWPRGCARHPGQGGRRRVVPPAVRGGSAGPRRALVTGAAGGIGRAAAARLAAEGVSVAILDIRGRDLAATAEQLRQSGADVLELPADIGDEQQIAAAVATVTSRWGGLDAAVAA